MVRQVAEEEWHSEELTAQLASLKGTTAEVEGAFRQGQAALAAYEAAQAASKQLLKNSPGRLMRQPGWLPPGWRLQPSRAGESSALPG